MISAILLCFGLLFCGCLLAILKAVIDVNRAILDTSKRLTYIEEKISSKSDYIYIEETPAAAEASYIEWDDEREYWAEVEQMRKG